MQKINPLPVLFLRLEVTMRQVKHTSGGTALRNFKKDVEAKREFARKINERAKMLGRRFSCQEKGCGQPAGLTVSLTNTSVSGLFTFKHSIDGVSVSHGRKSVLPDLHLVPSE